eukprot:TRINITY_DN1011_c0_g2_i1.p3 TRINITY_DN1011_c0_g2~~TRINITY_DN1011_c0_g2_i1.p3  ORF type:complete len:67 (-),score=2.92 TRINITY_DN1011_c0_g2_i1:112-312(-)
MYKLNVCLNCLVWKKKKSSFYLIHMGRKDGAVFRIGNRRISTRDVMQGHILPTLNQWARYQRQILR